MQYAPASILAHRGQRLTTEHPTTSRSLTPTLILWSMDGCPFCEKARAYLTEAGIPFREMKENDKAARQRLYDIWELPEGKRSFPQAWLDGSRIGGYDDLVRQDIAGQWRGLAA